MLATTLQKTLEWRDHYALEIYPCTLEFKDCTVGDLDICKLILDELSMARFSFLWISNQLKDMVLSEWGVSPFMEGTQYFYHTANLLVQTA